MVFVHVVTEKVEFFILNFDEDGARNNSLVVAVVQVVYAWVIDEAPTDERFADLVEVLLVDVAQVGQLFQMQVLFSQLVIELIKHFLDVLRFEKATNAI